MEQQVEQSLSQAQNLLQRAKTKESQTKGRNQFVRPLDDEILRKIDKMEQISTRIQQMSSNLFEKQQSDVHKSALSQLERMNDLIMMQSKKQFECFSQIEQMFTQVSNKENIKSQKFSNLAHKSSHSSSNEDDQIHPSRNYDYDKPIINEIRTLKNDVNNVKKDMDKISSKVQNSKEMPVSLSDPVPKLTKFNYSKINHQLELINIQRKMIEEDIVNEEYKNLDENIKNVDDFIQNIRLHESVNKAIHDTELEKPSIAVKSLENGSTIPAPLKTKAKRKDLRNSQLSKKLPPTKMYS